MERKSYKNMKRWCPVQPIDGNGLTLGGNFQFASMKNHYRVAFHFLFGNVAADGTISLQQAKNIGGSGAKTLAFTKYARQQCIAGDPRDQDKFLVETATGNAITVAAASNDGNWYIIEMKADELDVNNGFDCVRPNFIGGAGATLVAIWVEFLDPKYSGNQVDNNIFPSVLVGDQQ